MPDKFRYPFTRRYPVTSPYGYRLNPFTGVKEFHHGVDIGAPGGRVIHPIAPGVVEAEGYSTALGNWVRVNHGHGVRSTYGHMKTRTIKKVGQKVSRLNGLGRVGTTGKSTGNHLYLRVDSGDHTLNPQPYIDRH
jgi:murein DD-endopeptidase MepM/ murein hydrolase activator NlpD